MARINYSREKKEEILKMAAVIGASKAAKENNVSYATVLKWMKESAASAVEAVKVVPANTIAALGEQIDSAEAEINALTEQLNEKKAALKELRKAREKAEKIEVKAREAEEKRELIEEVLKSGKSIEEIKALLKG